MVRWYQNPYKVVIVSCFLGGVGWTFHAVLESFFFPDKTFLQLFITDVSFHDTILRMVVSGCFFFFGFIISKNFSQQHQAKQQLQQANEALQQANDSLERNVAIRTSEVKQLLEQKNDLLIGLSHDLKTPLTPLMGFLPMIEKEEQDPKLKKLLEICVTNVHFIRDLVSNTINLSLLDSSVLGLTMEKTHLLTEITTVIDDRAYSIKQHDIVVENAIPVSLFVNADKLRLREVLNNLISNSIKYSRSEGGTINLSATVKDSMVTIAVRDNGMGLTEEEKNHIFVALYKADPSRHDHSSTGLGLSICKKIIEKHGGTIWVESEGLGKGTTIFFTLSLAITLESEVPV